MEFVPYTMGQMSRIDTWFPPHRFAGLTEVCFLAGCRLPTSVFSDLQPATLIFPFSNEEILSLGPICILSQVCLFSVEGQE